MRWHESVVAGPLAEQDSEVRSLAVRITPLVFSHCEGAGGTRAVGLAGLIVAIFFVVAIFAAPPVMAAHVILAGIAVQGIWQKERGDRNTPTAMLWGRVCEHFYISPEDHSLMLARLGARKS